MKSGVVHIGVDVSKGKLDIYVPAEKEGSRPVTKEVGNNIKGFRELRDLARKAKATVCVEPTGGYELELIAFMHKFNVPVASVRVVGSWLAARRFRPMSSRRTRSFSATSTGRSCTWKIRLEKV